MDTYRWQYSLDQLFQSHLSSAKRSRNRGITCTTGMVKFHIRNILLITMTVGMEMVAKGRSVAIFHFSIAATEG